MIQYHLLMTQHNFFATVKYITSDISLQLDTSSSSDVTTASPITRRRSKLQNPENNISLFKLPNITIKTLKTTDNLFLTDTNFNVRRHFTVHYHLMDVTITIILTKYFLLN